MTRRMFALLLFLAPSLACDDDPTEPDDLGDPGIEIVSGAGQSDTIDAELAQGLVVVVRDSAGRLLPDVTVSFRSLPAEAFVGLLAADGYAHDITAAAETNGSGRAVVQIRMGYLAGTARVQVSVPEFGFSETVEFEVQPGAVAHAFVTPSDTARIAGASFAIGYVTRDRYGNLISDDALGNAGAYTVLHGPVTVSDAGVVTAGASFGTAQVEVEHAAGVDVVEVSVVPAGYLLGVDPAGPHLMRFRTDGEDLNTLVAGASSWVELHPTGSPSGAVVFQRDHPSTFLARATTPGTPLVSDGPTAQAWPQFTPDGETLVFAGGEYPEGTDQVWTVSADGGAAELLWQAAGHTQAPSISPSGAHLAVVVEPHAVIVDLATDSVVHTLEWANIAEYSPTQDRLAFLREGDLYLADGDGSGAELLASGGSTGFSPRNLSWSHDGEWIVVFAPVAPYSWEGEPVLVNADSGLKLPLGLNYSQASWAD